MSEKAARKLSEAAGIADQLRRAFEGGAWHGPALLELLEDVDAATAAAKPIPKVHSIWELVLHIAVWDDAALRRLGGQKWQPTGLANFPPVSAPTEAEWKKAVSATKRTHDMLVKTVCSFTRLETSRPRSRKAIRLLSHAAGDCAARALSCGADCDSEEGAGFGAGLEGESRFPQANLTAVWSAAVTPPLTYGRE